MKLKTLVLRKKADTKKSLLEKLNEELKKLEAREIELAEAIEDIDEETTEEDRVTVEEEVEALTVELETKKQEKKNLEEEIARIEEEIAGLEEDAEEVVEQQEDERGKAVETKRNKIQIKELRGGETMNLETREKIKGMLQREENRTFFRNIKDIFEKRAINAPLTNSELLIPEEVIVEIINRAENYGTLYNLVDVIKLKGTARIVILDGAVTFQWLECCDPLTETNLGEAKQIELDCFKYGGYVFVCDAFIEDAEIDFANFVMELFAEGWAKGVDLAIYAGLGAASKQPEGITMHVTDVTEVADLESLLMNLGGIKKGKGEKVIVMNEDTYSYEILPRTLGRDADGNIVYGLGQTLPNGVRVVTVEEGIIPAGEMIAGYFKEYKLGVRKEMTFDSNDRLKWIEGQVGYKMWGRLDGKPTDAGYFKRFKLVTEATTEPEVGA